MAQTAVLSVKRYFYRRGDRSVRYVHLGRAGI
jgi:hypothetical protein